MIFQGKYEAFPTLNTIEEGINFFVGASRFGIYTKLQFWV